MADRREITITKKKFGEDLIDEQIDYWQLLGVNEIWRATREVTLLGYALQGFDIKSDRINKKKVIKCVVPWAKQNTNEVEDA